VIALIVGAHFVPLARGFPARVYYVTALALSIVGVIGLFIDAIPIRITAVSAGSSAILWLTALSALVATRPPHSMKSLA
jgi:hypothetical protein